MTLSNEAWASYQQMNKTKQAHLDYLQHLEDKYQPYGQANKQEQNKLAELLKAHDQQVTLFREALAQLRAHDQQAYAEFVQRLANESLT